MSIDPVQDGEKGIVPAVEPYNKDLGYGSIAEVDPAQKHIKGTDWLSKKLQGLGVNVEDRGIERVPEDARTHTRISDLVLLWGSTNFAISNFSLGLLGPAIFGLGLSDSVLVILFFVMANSVAVAYLATFGPKTGLRQMTVSRFSFGWYGNKVMAFLNSCSCLGWSAVNVTIGGQTLATLSNNRLPIPAAIVIIAVLTWFVAMVGYRWVHLYERYQWIPIMIVYFILLGEGAHNFVSVPMPSGSFEAGNVLSFGCALTGGALGWAPFASDYDVNMPVNTPSWKVFVYTWLGLVIPVVLIMSLGAAFGAGFSANETWADGYDANSIGGVFGAALAPLNGFGTFCMIILALSVVGGNLPNSYSLALSFQNIHPMFTKVPRFLWTTIGTIVYIGIGIAAAYDFAESLTTFMSILSYFLALYSTIVILEHIAFRKRNFSNYNLAAYDDKSQLPVGFAGITAFCFGIAGIVIGMSQIWYMGVIGRLIGDPDYGGDIAFELAAVFAGITYPIARFFEKKYLKRY